MKKTTLLMIVSVVLAMTLSLGGTLAYLKDQDADVNVMTLGNVYIEQHEYQRAEGVAHNATASKAEKTLVPFVEGQPLYPAVPQGDKPYTAAMTQSDGFKWGDYVYTGTAWNGLWYDDKLANVVDKFVFVENTGKSAAYIRTIIAYECPEGYTVGDAGMGADIGININERWTETKLGFIEIDDTRYDVREYNYTNGALAAGNTAHPSLLQIVMNHEMGNEDMVAIDGNKNGTYDVLVLSQAVQAAGFDNAADALEAGFPYKNTNGSYNTAVIAGWFGDVVPVKAVTTAAELEAALANANGGTVALANDIAVSNVIEVKGDFVLDLGGHKLNASANAARPFEMTEGASLTINANGGEVVCGKYGLVNVPNDVKNVNITLNGGTYNAATNEGAFIRLRNGNTNTHVVMNDVTVNDTYRGAKGGYIYTTEDATAVDRETQSLTINGGKFTANAGFITPSNAVIKNATITTNGHAFEVPGKNVVIDTCIINVAPGGTVLTAPGAGVSVSLGGHAIVKNCTIALGNDAEAGLAVYPTGGSIVAENNTVTPAEKEYKIWDNSNSKITIDGIEKK